MNNKFKFAGTYGLCIGVVFGTAASYFGKNGSKSYVNIMSKYITGSAVSIVALLSIQGLINIPSRIASSNKSSAAAATARRITPLEHLKVLNYQNCSISSSSLISAIPLFCSLNIHRRK